MEYKSDMERGFQKKDDFDIDIQSCSTMDCTGLIPSLPQSDAEVEHYNQLYRFLPEHVREPKEKN